MVKLTGIGEAGQRKRREKAEVE